MNEHTESHAMVKIESLCKRFADLRALDNLALTVNKGDIYGFIGPNGAGKTTTFRILATIMKQDSGSVRIDDIESTCGDKIRSLIGYMPDVFGVYEDMTLYQYLDFFGAAYWIPPAKRKVLVNDILALTDLTFKKDAMVQSLSRGMQQRLGIARVLIHDPKLLILDEPASGLDPRARIELRELLKELSLMGKTILISSHILSELSDICNRVGIIEQGKTVFEGSREELEDRIAGQRVISIDTVPTDRDKALALLRAAPFTNSVKLENGTISLTLHEHMAERSEIPTFLVEHGCSIARFQAEEISLEKAFMSLTEGKLA